MGQQFILVAAFAVLSIGCNRSGLSDRSFDQEFDLTLRAGRGELSDDEKSRLLKDNHPILAQVGEPRMVPLMQLFARLTPELHAQLLHDSYVKWKYSELPDEARETTRQVIHYTVETQFGRFARHDEAGRTTILQPRLDDVDVGFAVIELPRTRQKVVSWFAFGSDLPSPLWITIVNSPASNAEEYVQAHMRRLPLLRTMKSSGPPSLVPDRVTYIATADTDLLCSNSG